jgi:signal peptidase I
MGTGTVKHCAKCGAPTYISSDAVDRCSRCTAPFPVEVPIEFSKFERRLWAFAGYAVISATVLVFIGAISAAVARILYKPLDVAGNGMSPQIQDGDSILVSEPMGRFVPIHQGDVVTYRDPQDREYRRMARVIASPGDRLRIDQGVVWLNGTRQKEPYVLGGNRDRRSMAELTIPVGSYFLMGDNRSLSSDSREFGPVERSLIYGKAVFVYWPTRDAGVVH